MCYNTHIANPISSTGPRCSQCGSLLILIDTVTEKIDGAFYPQARTTYRCSSDSCQAEIDKETAKRVKMRDDKRIENEKRAEKKVHDKQQSDLRKLMLENS